MSLLDVAIIVAMTGSGVFIDRLCIYALFIYLCVRKVNKRKVDLENFLSRATIYSLILPDNYLSGGLFVLWCIRAFKKNRSFTRMQGFSSIIVFLWCVNAWVSTLINDVPLVNVLFSVVTFAPFVCFLFALSNVNKIKFSFDEKQIDEILLIEIVATVFNYLYFWGSSTDAWSCGTFSDKGGEQAQLMVLMGMFSLLYFIKYKNNRDKICLCKCFLCMLIVCSTFTWSLTIVFLCCFLLLLFDRNKYVVNREKWHKQLIPAIALVCVCVGMIQLSPDFIRDSIIKMLSDSSFFEYRFYKAVLYKITFVDIPSVDNMFLWFGNGLGYYCSRAALICSGHYVNFYDIFFQSSYSHYTNEYIMDYLVKAQMMSSSDYGSVLARPYSSLLMLMGETGLLGVIMFFVWCVLAARKRKGSVRILLLFWMGVCLFENFFEYSKVVLCLLVCCVSVLNIKHEYHMRKIV